MSAPAPRRSGRIVAVLCLILLPLTFFFRPLFLGEAFLPADLLGYLSPWKASAAFPPPSPTDPPVTWNVLRFDGITQYYPWRLQAARELHTGHIPLWNPYQFAASGGTPLLANSQSAPLYPPNLLFWLTPPDRFWYAFGLSAALHMLWAALGLYRLMRALGLGRIAAVFGAASFALSAPIVTWLSLPTFLAVASWFPWLLLLLKRAHDLSGTNAGRLAAVGAGGVTGMLLLAGHLQMAFYGMLAGGLFLLWRGHYFVWRSPKEVRGKRAGIWATAVVGGAVLALCLALPQVLPALSLSRISHRASVDPPSAIGYQIYVGNALPLRQFATLLVPGYYGNPNNGSYWEDSDRRGGNNYAEWAMYAGVVPLLLAAFALALPWRGPIAEKLPFERQYFAILGAFVLLLALGTPLNAPFFFFFPGYSQTGNPARCLVLLTLSLASLGAIGLDTLLRGDLPQKALRRASLIAIVVPLLLTAIGASLGAKYAAFAVSNVPFAQLMAFAQPDITKGGIMVVFTAIGLFALPGFNEERRAAGGVLLALLAAADLFAWGIGYNPTTPAAQVYPTTPGIDFLQANGKDALIAVINRHWTVNAVAPHGTALPPNALTVYGLHDIGGYDSLFLGTAKRQVQEAGGEDPAPPENGNMVFVKKVSTAVALGARYIAVAPEVPEGTPQLDVPLHVVYNGPDLRIYENPAGQNAPAAPTLSFDTFRIGLFCGLCGAGVLGAAGAASGVVVMRSRQDQRQQPELP